MSPASFSFPLERTPSPLEDYESPKVHLETGEKFTRQGIFVNNMVVPTDICDDPSFFSGLSKSNTPDTIQTVLDKEQENDSEGEMDGEDIYFEPVVQLPSQVEFRSGEEDETVIFEERTKLFRFQDGEWKERGLGNLKLLWNNTSGQARILMRREKVLKICANHFLTQDMTLNAGKGSDRSWVWSTLADISDDETKPQKFAAKFQTKEIAEKFKAKVEELQQKKASFVPESPAVSPFAANPLATKPTPDHMKMPVLSSNLPYLSSTPNKPAGATKPSLQSYADGIQSTASTVEPFSSETIADASQKNSGVADAANFWNQPQVFPGIPNMPYFQSHKPSDNSKEPQLPQAPQLGSEQPLSLTPNMPYFQSHKPSDNSKEPQLPQVPQLGSEQPLSLAPTAFPSQNTFSFTFGSKPEASPSLGNVSSTSNETFKNKDESGIFGNVAEKGGLSFQDLVSNNAFTSPGTSGTGFTGFGKPIFSVPDNEREEESDIENETNIDFKPIVSLPLVKNQATGEEGELVKFSERAKLFRFDPASKEWKERGLGEMKLLYDPSSGKSRVVMRREQVHKLCANHFILPSMKLKANTTSNRSWLWYTHADVSDGEPKAEQLAVKFKQEETASEFKKVFEELQSISPTSKASDPDADQDTSTNMPVPPNSTSKASDPDADQDTSTNIPVPPNSQSTEPSSQPNNDLKLQFQPPSGSWSCNTCLVQNSPQSTQCVACQAPKPGVSTQIQHPTFSFIPPSGFSLGSTGTGGPTSTNGIAKSGFNPGFMFGSPSFSFQSQPPKDETTESVTSKSGPNSGLLFGSDKTSPSEFNFGEEKVGKPPFVFSFPKSNNDASQRSTNSPFFQITPTSQATEPVNETSLKGLPTQSSAPANNLRLAFQPAEGSWECDTCLVRNTPESNVCAACQSSRPGTQPAVINPGFNFNIGTSSEFSFGTSDATTAPTAGTGFNFGSSGVKKDTSQGTGFSFGPADANKDASQTGGFSFGHSDGSKAPITGSSFGSQDGKKDITKGPNFSFVPSDESKDVNNRSGFSFGASDANKSPAVTNDLKLAFQPAEGSWECDTCLVRNTPESNVCAACESPKPGTQSTATNSGFNFNTGTSSGFGFGAPSAGTGFNFVSNAGSKDTTQGTGFSFGPSDASKDTSKEDGFSFGPADANKDTTEAPALTSNLKLAFQPPVGSWECDTCLVRNTPQSNVCAACQSSKPGTQPASTHTAFNSNTGTSRGFSFGPQEPAKESGGFSPGPADANKSPAVMNDLKLAFQPAEGSWECDTCLVRNTPESNVCAACQSPKPGTQSTATNSGFNFNTSTSSGFSFGPQEPAKGTSFSFGSLGSGDTSKDTAQGTGFSFGPSDASKDTSQGAGFSFGSADANKDASKEDGFSFGPADANKDATEAPALTSNLKLAFQPPVGSWECDTCLVRNTPESNVCAACQSSKPGTQPKSTHTAFNSNTGTSRGFSFGPQEPAKGSGGFSFGPQEKESGSFSFGPQEKGSGGFSFGPGDTSELSSAGAGFTFAPTDKSKDQNSGTGFTFVPKDGHSGEGPNFNFAPSSANKDSTEEIGFSIGDESKDSKSTPGFTSFDDDDTESEETTGSDYDSEASEEYSHEASRSGKETHSADFAFQDKSSNVTTGGDDIKQKFLAPEGSWDCDVCLLRNDKQSNSCVACETLKPGAEQLDSNTFAFGQSFPNQGGDGFSSSAESGVPPTAGFTFGKPSSGGFTFGKPLSEGFTFGSGAKDSQQSGLNLSAPTNSSSEFSFGSTLQTKDTENFGPTSCESKGGSDKPAISIGSLGDANKGFSFGSTATTGFNFGDGQTSQPEFNFGDGQTSHSEFNFGDGQTSHSEFNFGDGQTSQSGFNFGSSGDDTSRDGLHLENKKEEDVSKDLPKREDATNLLSQGDFTFHLDIPKEPTMISPSNKDMNVSEDNPEAEDEHVVFKPIVSLPSQVEVKTGEEDETTLFSSHAKLYRFTENTWKERGVGEIKVLYDPTLKRGRLIMRRDQVHILCANHIISQDMKLQPQGSSGKSWLWHVQGDFAENELKEQLFAVKFRDTDSALAFQRAFEECLNNKVNSLDEDIKHEVIVVYEVSVTDQQRTRAEKFLLPPNFYSYENQNEAVLEEKQDVQQT